MSEQDELQQLRHFRERVKQFVGRDDDPDDDLIIARLNNLRSWALEMAEELRNQQ